MYSTNRPKVERCIDKALQLGIHAALDDLPRSGKKVRLSPEGRVWLVSLACQKPKDLGYSLELWTRGCWRSIAENIAKRLAIHH